LSLARDFVMPAPGASFTWSCIQRGLIPDSKVEAEESVRRCGLAHGICYTSSENQEAAMSFPART